MTTRKSKEIPGQLREKIAAFDQCLTDVENKFEPILNVTQIELNSKLSSLDKAKLDLVAAYSINSLFWMYLNVCGVNPKDHGIKQELERIRGYMNRVKEIQDKEKAPKLNVQASKRFVKSALWNAAQKSLEDQAAKSTAGAEPQVNVAEQSKSQPSPGNRKRRAEDAGGKSRGKHSSAGNFGKKRYKDVPKD